MRLIMISSWHVIITTVCTLQYGNYRSSPSMIVEGYKSLVESRSNCTFWKIEEIKTFQKTQNRKNTIYRNIYNIYHVKYQFWNHSKRINHEKEFYVSAASVRYVRPGSSSLYDHSVHVVQTQFLRIECQSRLMLFIFRRIRMLSYETHWSRYFLDTQWSSYWI